VSRQVGDEVFDFESAEEAMLEGDEPFRPGTARAAWQYPTFRRIYLGAFASNIGTWMQNVVLGALAYELTHSPVFVGVMVAAQLSPLLLLSVVGGILADSVDRKKLLIWLTVEQGFFSAVLGLVAFQDHPSKVVLVAIVALIGVGNALYAPVFSAVLPVLVPRRDIGGAISLNSAQMNGSRVIGPAIGAVLYAHFGAGWVFELNALSYLAVIVVIAGVRLPAPPASGSQGWHRVVEGFAVARRDRVVRHCISVIFIFSLTCLPFITQMPLIAGHHLGISPKSGRYGLLYASFGVGAVAGALSIGTVFASYDKARVCRISMAAFAVFVGTFGVLRAPTIAYPVAIVLGAAYFAVITSLSTILQEEIDDAVRGKVMALWIMGFGGTVPIGGLIGGWLIERSSIGLVIGGGAVVALVLAAVFDFRPDPASRTAGAAPLVE
jgi:MFS family permease